MILKHLNKLHKNKEVYEFQEKAVSFIIYLSYFLYLVIFLGLSSQAPKYLETLNFYFRLYICLFLLIRYNPLFRIHDFTDLDRRICFSAGVFILTSTYMVPIRNYIIGLYHKYTKKNTGQTQKQHKNTD